MTETSLPLSKIPVPNLKDVVNTSQSSIAISHFSVCKREKQTHTHKEKTLQRKFVFRKLTDELL